ncbi:hypothetical protein TWF102_005952 [Orbilia oligospora]|uniref:Uncharacterized protein n=1 Tax=Orbilia oligospora TaxID=2813651 RepID=A0A7C8JF13_ORBOL|nr:hypothetical protein TWF102_005952 [Orbilia oligospora]
MPTRPRTCTHHCEEPVAFFVFVSSWISRLYPNILDPLQEASVNTLAGVGKIPLSVLQIPQFPR